MKTGRAVAALILAFAIPRESIAAGLSCTSPFELAEIIRQHLFARWFDISPTKLRHILEADLSVVADGAGPLLQLKGDSCEALFGFRQETGRDHSLNSLTVIARGPKEAMVAVAESLSSAVQMPLPTASVNDLRQGATVDLSVRVPADPRIAGTLRMLTIELQAQNQWVLDFHFTYARDR